MDGYNSLIETGPISIDLRCATGWGATLSVGIDDGDPSGTAGDGMLQAGEVDSLLPLCVLPPELENGSFETGDFTGWVIQDLSFPLDSLAVGPSGASDGMVGVTTGFDGDGGPGNDEIFVAQEVDLTGVLSVGVSFDWEVPSCNNGGVLDRVFNLVVEPIGGGAALLTEEVYRCVAGSFDSSPLVDDQLVDISSVANQPVRIKFQWIVPEDYTGPASAYLDDVRLVYP